MKILIIDDDPNKVQQLSSFVAEHYASADQEVRRSFQSGLKALLLEGADIVLLDMTMPNYDVGGRDSGGRERRYAGQEILRQIKRKGKACRVVVVTQFESFGEGKELKTLAQLRTAMKEEFPGIFVGAIFYQVSNATWRVELKASVDVAIESMEGK